jgi:hypothetical protein
MAFRFWPMSEEVAISFIKMTAIKISFKIVLIKIGQQLASNWPFCRHHTNKQIDQFLPLKLFVIHTFPRIAPFGEGI